MRVGIITFGGDGGKSGISRYIIKLLEQFDSIQDGTDFEVVVYENEKSIFIPSAERMSSVCCAERLRNPVLNVAWHQVGLPRLCYKRGYDVLFLPAANRRMPFWVPCPTVGTVHDFSSTHVEEKYDPARMFFIKKVTPVLIRRLDMVLTVSENSKKDIVSFCRIPEERVVVTPNGVDLDVYYPGDRDQAFSLIKREHDIRKPFILYVSRIEHPGKNHVGLIRAFSLLKEKTGLPHQLVLAGSEWSRADEVYKVAEQSPHVKDISFIGFVKNSDLPSLYRAADLFAFPSLYEGFGMPILEAMACGTPVVCSNQSSMPEVAGDAALLFDPYDEEDICLKMEQILSNPSLREQCVIKGLQRSSMFSWSSTAIKTIDVIRQTWEASR
jgi:glycosyltransferase involved in cell wall biosynthesis